MKLQLARLGVLLAALLGLMATMVPSASANTYKLITFTGNADLSGGLGYPGALPDNKLPCGVGVGVTPGDPLPTVSPQYDPTCVTYKSGPKNEPQVNVTPGGNNVGFVFNSAVCVKTSISSPNKPTQKNGVDPCTITAAGTVTGFCGLSTGTGAATIINDGTAKATVSVGFKFTGIGGVLHVSGGNKETNLYAEVSAVPNVSPGGPSCTNKTATTFILTGVGYYKNCTKGTTAGVCNPV